MLTQHAFARPVVVLAAALLLALATGCSKPVDQGGNGAAPDASAQAATALLSKKVSKLGDLSEFRSIASDVLGIVDKSDLPAAKARIKDLEVAWDTVEAGLKPRAADDWHVVDNAIDIAMAGLRADEPRQADCKAALTNLLKTFDTLQGKV